MANLRQYSAEAIKAAMTAARQTIEETAEELDFDEQSARLIKKTIDTYEHALRVLLGRGK